MHIRRSNVSLGVATVDLSGPHEASPRPNKHITKEPCYYYLVLTVRPDDTATQVEAGVQTELTGEDLQHAQPEPDGESGQVNSDGKRKPALIYAAVFGSKKEAAEAVKRLLAQVNNDHAKMLTEIVFRLHSDQGGEFNSDDLKEY